MTLNAKIGFLWILWQFRSVTHILRVNCVEITTDIPVQLAYKIFDIKCGFKRSKSQPFRFKIVCVRGHQRWVPSKKSLFYCYWLHKTDYALWRV